MVSMAGPENASRPGAEAVVANSSGLAAASGPWPAATSGPWMDLFAAMNARDGERLAALLDPEAVFHFPKTAPLLGAERILRFFELLWRGYPELHFTVQAVIVAADGQRAAVHWMNAGRTREGTAYANEGVTLLSLRAGRLVWISDFFKDTERF
jgi:ketosteroid isomerase-like protein